MIIRKFGVFFQEPQKPFQSVYRFLGMTMALLIVASCTATAPVAEPEAPLEKTELVWPGPPQQPRIRYLGEIHWLPDGSEKQELELRDILLGREQAKTITKKLVKPSGVHSDSKGRIYITDSTIAGVVVWDLEKKIADFWGTSGQGTLFKAVGITSDESGNVYVSDTAEKKVVAFDHDGNFLKAFGGKDELLNPVGLAFSESTQQLFVVDSKLHKVLAYDRAGNLLMTIGERGHEQGKFNFPTNLAIAPDGKLYVADSMNFRIQVFEQDGTFVRSFGEVGLNPGNFNRLKGIGIDTEGHIYATDASYNNFQIFDEQGNLLLAVGKAGRDPGTFNLPAGLHVDENNKILIADSINNRVQMFEYITGATPE